MRPLILLGIGLLAFSAAFLVPDQSFRLAFMTLSGVLLAAGAGLLLMAQRGLGGAAGDDVSAALEADSAASFISDSEGRIETLNSAGKSRFSPNTPETVGRIFRDLFANPTAVQIRIQTEASEKGVAREDVVTRRGHLQISAAQLGRGRFIWRIEDLGTRSPGRGTDLISLPMLTAGPSGTILYMNEAFKKLTGGRSRSLDLVFRDLPLVSGRRHTVDTVNGPVSCLVAEVSGQGGRKEVYLIPAGPDGTADATGPASGWDTIEQLPVPLLKLAPTGEVLAASPQARALLPMPIGPGTRMSELLEGLGRPIIDWLRETAEGRGQPGPQFLQGTGAHRDTFLQVTLGAAGEGDGRFLIALLNDVSELKSLEARFVQSQKMQAIGQLAGGVAHDFNNLLTAISGHCDFLLLRHDEADPDYPDLVQIHQNANRAASLVGQLLAFSRKQNLVTEVLDLRDTLSDLTHLLNRLVGERVTLDLSHATDLRMVRADKRQLEQVLMNLVVNARDAMKSGGEIRIETSNVTLSAPMERDRAKVPAGDWVVVRVIDQGEGIDAEKLPKIFEPFYTSKRPGEGTGLGLSTAYGIVKQTGGFIFVDSEVGKGSTFSLYFPAQDAPASERAAAPSKPEIDMSEQGEGVVLLVEDEAPVRAFASRALRMRGYSVLEADSAEAALKLLSDPELSIDVFVTDVIMPGMDGPTWVREALQDRPDTKVIFVSGYAEDAFGENQALIPNSVFLPKPFSLSDLTRTVHGQIGARDA